MVDFFNKGPNNMDRKYHCLFHGAHQGSFEVGKLPDKAVRDLRQTSSFEVMRDLSGRHCGCSRTDGFEVLISLTSASLPARKHFTHHWLGVLPLGRNVHMHSDILPIMDGSQEKHGKLNGNCA